MVARTGTRTLVTAANLQAIQYTHPTDGNSTIDSAVIGNQITPAAIATLNALAKYDAQGALTNQEFDPNGILQTTFQIVGHGGVLHVPARGQLRVRQGDIIALDTATGWPILVSAAAAAGAGWTLSAVTG